MKPYKLGSKRVQNQCRICAQAPSLPDAVVERTKKDKCFNDLLHVVEQKGLIQKLSSGHAGHSSLKSPLLCGT